MYLPSCQNILMSFPSNQNISHAYTITPDYPDAFSIIADSLSLGSFHRSRPSPCLFFLSLLLHFFLLLFSSSSFCFLFVGFFTSRLQQRLLAANHVNWEADLASFLPERAPGSHSHGRNCWEESKLLSHPASLGVSL